MNQLLATLLIFSSPAGLATGEDTITSFPNADQDRAGLAVLEHSLEPLVDRFNKDKGKLRFVAILSPT